MHGCLSKLATLRHMDISGEVLTLITHRRTCIEAPKGCHDQGVGFDLIASHDFRGFPGRLELGILREGRFKMASCVFWSFLRL